MKSETAEAFTDGRRNIYIHEKFLSGEKHGPKHAITWAVGVAHLLVHEYLHDDNNGTGCVHDAEFHESYHSVTSSHGFAEAVRYLFEIYADKVKRAPTGIFARTLDRVAAIEDKVGAVQLPSGEIAGAGPTVARQKRGESPNLQLGRASARSMGKAVRLCRMSRSWTDSSSLPLNNRGAWHFHFSWACLSRATTNNQLITGRAPRWARRSLLRAFLWQK